MKQALWLFLGFCFLSFAPSIWATPQTVSAKEQLATTMNEIIDIVEAHESEAQRQERRAQILVAVKKRFDFAEMSKRSLGPEWLNVNFEQRQEFVEIFSDLLARTYINKVDEIRRNMVDIKDEKIEGNKSLVKTIVNYKDDRFPIDYKLLLRDDQWKVYDVVIENIGLVANYRNEFAGIIRKEKFAGLIKRLNQKNLAATE